MHSTCRIIHIYLGFCATVVVPYHCPPSAPPFRLIPNCHATDIARVNSQPASVTLCMSVGFRTVMLGLHRAYYRVPANSPAWRPLNIDAPSRTSTILLARRGNSSSTTTRRRPQSQARNVRAGFVWSGLAHVLSNTLAVPSFIGPIPNTTLAPQTSSALSPCFWSPGLESCPWRSHAHGSEFLHLYLSWVDPPPSKDHLIRVHTFYSGLESSLNTTLPFLTINLQSWV